MTPSVGRIVHYRLTATDVAAIDERKKKGERLNPHSEGQVLPMVIAVAWTGPDGVATETTCINGQVFLDGEGSLWACSLSQGKGPGQWSEPPRVS